MLSLVLTEPTFERCDSLRLIFLGGEAADRGLIRELRSRTTAVIVNEYGPTEATIDVTAARLDGVDDVHIGTPIDNVSVHVLGPRLDLIPDGITGELCIGGIGVARGYACQPALTAERFVPDPYGAPGSRMYRSGDFARRHPDGSIEFLGRRDEQVSIHGYRIELGEVRAALLQCPGVADAAVTVADSGSAATSLVAFVVPVSPQADLDTIRAHLSRHLPGPMLPKRITIVPRFPLTAAGKIDWTALVAATASPTARPEGDLEVAIALVWQDFLPQRGALVGRDDDFYQLGGHSLTALRVLSFIHRELGVPLPVRNILAAPTVAKLAAMVEAREQWPGAARQSAGAWLHTRTEPQDAAKPPSRRRRGQTR
jgi:acyl-coenzyme A synthetase/AMP-(fatty) acid ligase